MTQDELMREVLVLPRHPAVLLPDTEVISRPDWHSVFTPSLKQGVLNEVALAVLREEDVEDAITVTLEKWKRVGSRMRWSVMPDSRPLDLSARLAARGLVRSETRAMYRDTSPLPGEVSPLEVRRIDESTAGIFTEVMARGWAMDPEPMRALNLGMARNLRCSLFVGYLNGVPVGAGGMVRFDRSAYVLGGVVLEEARRRGVYRALVAHRLALARAAGLEVITVHAIAQTSAPLLEKLGFVDLVSYPTFTLPR